MSAPRPKPAKPPVTAVVPRVNLSWHHVPGPHRWDDEIRENTGGFDLSGETEVPLKNIAESEAEHARLARAVAVAENARIGRRNCTLMIPEPTSPQRRQKRTCPSYCQRADCTITHFSNLVETRASEQIEEERDDEFPNAEEPETLPELCPPELTPYQIKRNKLVIKLREHDYEMARLRQALKTEEALGANTSSELAALRAQENQRKEDEQRANERKRERQRLERERARNAERIANLPAGTALFDQLSIGLLFIVY